ncbi:MAG: FAD-dependent oxidoreductase [Deltaproteobacteria bacterium]|nr:MAG: FAD-dependent oxidoreductase [Deltaproteobacteria bacterium]
MSRPILTRLLRRIAEDAPTSAERRAFLKGSVALGASMLVSSRSWAASPTKGRVLILGGGLAGLSAAFECRAAGLDAQVFEARSRVGGRVLSIAGDGQHHEAGAELIGTNHPRWLAYAEQLDLSLSPLTDHDGDEVVILDGKQLSKREVQQLWRRLNRPIRRLTKLAREVPATTPWRAEGAASLDLQNVHAYLMDRGGHPEGAAFLSMLFGSDAAVPSEAQSLLGLLACIQGGGGERFWTESEALRCAGGNQSLAQKLAEKLGDRVSLRRPVRAVRWGASPPQIELEDGTTHEGDAIVLAVPPTVWGAMTFDPPLPPELRPSMGPAVKHLTRLRRAVWDDTQRSPAAYADGVVSLTWDGTEGQAGEKRWLVAFSGAGQADRGLALSDEARETRYTEELEGIFPGFREVAEERRYYDWPRDPLTLAGYSCPGVGEVTTIQRTLHEGLFPLLFAGEHCSTAFPGYMEGALESGVRTARALVAKLG